MQQQSLRRALGIMAALALAATACGGNGGSGDAGGTSHSVDATVKDFAITLDPSSVTAGDVEFSITNDGPSVHEFVVLGTDLAAGELPVEGSEVNEDDASLSSEGEAEDIEPGTTASLTLNLAAGSYVVICNISGHYTSGMRAAFTVS